MGVTKKQVFQPFLELYFNPCTNREEHNVGIYMILTPYSDISIHTPPHMMQLLILVANSSKHFAIWCFHGFCATPLRQLAIQACVVWSYHLILTDRIGSPQKCKPLMAGKQVVLTLLILNPVLIEQFLVFLATPETIFRISDVMADVFPTRTI